MLVVSFHSYKGGSCRTSTCINTLPYLVKKLGADAEHPILVVDLDIDSQGLTYLVGAENQFNEYDSKVMLLNRIPDRNRTISIDQHEFFKKCVPIGERLGVENKAVYCLGLNDTQPMDAQDFTGRIDSALMALYSMCLRMGVKAIVYDTASGDQLAASAACKASKVMVCCMRPTKQFCIGTARFLGRLRKSINDQIVGKQITRVIVLPTAVPQKEIMIEGVNQRNDANNRIRAIVRDTPYEVSNAFIVPENFGIPEVERFKWHEDILFNLNRRGELTMEDDSALAMKRYEHLAEVIIEEGMKIDD